MLLSSMSGVRRAILRTQRAAKLNKLKQSVSTAQSRADRKALSSTLTTPQIILINTNAIYTATIINVINATLNSIQKQKEMLISK